MQCRVEHVGLAAGDPAGLKDWYVRVLGARVVFDNHEQPPAFLLQLPGGGALVEIYPAEGAAAAPKHNRVPGWRHLALRVPAIDATRADLAARGVEFSEPVKPAGGGGRVLFFRDPEGNLLHLVERPAGAID